MSTISSIIIIAVLIIAWIIWIYNKFVTLKNRAKEAWSDIDVQLKRRHNLIPNLVEAVKGYMAHESKVYEKVTEARAKTLTATTNVEKAEAENMLTDTLKSLFAVAENYPDLKASTNFLDLQRELADTENKIQAARRFYNTMVRDYNTKVEVFPPSIIAGFFKFTKIEFFETKEELEREPVKIRL